MIHCILPSSQTEDGAFGPKTADVEYHAKSNWVLLRGNRYQVLEQEFFEYTLKPHTEALKRVYGVGAKEIAAGFQDIATSIREGHSSAFENIIEGMKSTQELEEQNMGLSADELREALVIENPEIFKKASQSLEDIFYGGVCNLSNHSRLPENILSDLAFCRGEELDFFADGEYCGTPFRTLPARKKPLIKLGNDYFSIDPCFARDSGYRALLWNLLERETHYKEEFEAKQKEMSEAAFPDIFASQFSGAKVNQEVWYKDVDTGQWCENDTLIRIDDAIILVEAKAGAAATIASPELDFDRHVRSIKDLIVKAYKQCERFFKYLSSKDIVPIFKRENGKYIEIDQIKFSDYRVVLPMGLTVESFSPFSAMCKELPELDPVLGMYPFISTSIDDLFVVGRFLKTGGELLHYYEVRQAIAGIKGVKLYDETDHLGAYIEKNRIDQDINEQLSTGTGLIILGGMCEKIDMYFEGEDWTENELPCQKFPYELGLLLDALNTSQKEGWLSCDSVIRDLEGNGRIYISGMLGDYRRSLSYHKYRYFSIPESPQLLMIWLQRTGTTVNEELLKTKAAASAIFQGESNIICILATVSPLGEYQSAERVFIEVPDEKNDTNYEIFEEGRRA